MHALRKAACFPEQLWNTAAGPVFEARSKRSRLAPFGQSGGVWQDIYYDDTDPEYYDAYDYDGVKTANGSASSASSTSESAPSTGDSTDSASSGSETPSKDSSSSSVQTAEAMKPETDAGNTAETAAEKGAA